MELEDATLRRGKSKDNQRNVEIWPQEEVRAYGVPWGSSMCSTKYGEPQISECHVRVGGEGLRYLLLYTGPGGLNDNPLQLHPAGKGIGVRNTLETHYHHLHPSSLTPRPADT